MTPSANVEETVHRGFSTMNAHRHERPFVTVVVSGGYIEVCDTEPSVCGAGSIVVHDGSEEHADHFTADTRCLNIELPHDAFAGKPPCARTLDRESLRDAARTVVRAFYDDPHNVTGALAAFDAALKRRPDPQPAQPQWLETVVREFPWTEPRPFREAAARAGVHETHFSRTFRHVTGMTANEYRTRARVRLASQMLLCGSDSLSRISLAAGFSDQSHFTRAFGRYLGLSPAGYRKIFAR